MSLEKLRKEIDNINTKLLDLIKQRLDIGMYIGLNKKKLNLPIKDEEREKKMMEQIHAQCNKRGLNKEFIDKLFQLIIAETIRVEEET